MTKYKKKKDMENVPEEIIKVIDDVVDESSDIPELKGEEIKGVMEVIKATPYKGCTKIIRRLFGYYFEYLVVHEGQIYNGYTIIKPPKDQKELTEDQVLEGLAVIDSGAMATLDMLLGEKVSEADQAKVDLFEENREKIEGNL